MALIDHIDPINRRIYLSADTVDTSINPIDIYKEMRELRRLDESLRPYDIFMEGKGHIPKGSGKYTERYTVLIEGTLLVPYDTSHTLTITGTVITDSGYEGVYCFDRSPLSSTTTVSINYVPPQVEVITVQAGSGLSTEQDTMLKEIRTGIEMAINVDVNNITSGDGTPANPFNNFDLAVSYGDIKHIKKIIVHSSMSLDVDINGYEIEGLNQQTLDLNGKNIGGSSFYNLQITGSSTGYAVYRQCNILSGTLDMNGVYYTTGISGNCEIELNQMVTLIKCMSTTQNGVYPSIKFNGNSYLAIRQYSGGISISNMHLGCSINIGITDGKCIFESDCDGGDVHISGTGFYENLGTVIVHDIANIKNGVLTSDEHNKLMDVPTAAENANAVLDTDAGC